jgi:hypothetical protein
MPRNAYILGGHPKPANASEVTTGSDAQRTADGAATSTSEPWRELIEAALSYGRNAMSIWHELVDQHGFSGPYESVKRYVLKLRGTQSPEARAIIQTAPGEESQVDYGTGPMVPVVTVSSHCHHWLVRNLLLILRGITRAV